jgi:hypothetical protein
VPTVRPANGPYEFECKLFDAATEGNQIGLTLTVPATVRIGFITSIPQLDTLAISYFRRYLRGEATNLECADQAALWPVATCRGRVGLNSI